MLITQVTKALLIFPQIIYLKAVCWLSELHNFIYLSIDLLIYLFMYKSAV